MASFRVSGLVPMSAAIAGSEVAMTVESMFSMNSAVATMRGIRRCLFIKGKGEGSRKGALSAHGHQGYCGRRQSTYVLTDGNAGETDDLRPRRPAAAAWPASERPAVRGVLRRFRADLSRSAAGAVGPCRHCGAYEARGA